MSASIQYQQFAFPEIPLENPNGWGPSEPLARLSYLPLIGSLCQSTKLEVADWYPRRNHKTNTINYRQKLPEVFQKRAGTEGEDFDYVTDGKKRKKPTYGRSRLAAQRSRLKKQQQRETLKLRKEANRVETGARTFGGHVQQRRNKRQKWRNRNRKMNYNNRGKKNNWHNKNDNQFKFEPSIQTPANWQHKKDVWLDTISSLNFDISAGNLSQEILGKYGKARTIKEKGLKKIMPNKPIPIKMRSQFKRNLVSASDDPHMKTFEGDVFITGELMAALMTCNFAKLSFDFIVTKEDDKLYFDLRSESNLHTPQPDEGCARFIVKEAAGEKYLKAIAEEADKLGKSFHRFCLNHKADATMGVDGPSDFDNQFKQLNSTSYMYKRYTIGGNSDDPYTIVTRLRADGYDLDGNPVLICPTTQHSFRKSYQASEWNKEIARKFGACKSTDVKNNRFRYCRWALEATLGDIDSLVLGFISRQFAEQATTHHVLQVKTISRREFAQKWCNLRSTSKRWGLLDAIIQEFRNPETEDGKYCVQRDSNPEKERLSISQVDDRDLEENDIFSQTRI